MRCLTLFFGGALLVTVARAADDSWRPLFNGKDLSGWNTFIGKPDKAWDVPGLKRDDNGNYSEPIGVNHDPLKVFTVETVDGNPAIHISGQGFGTMTTTNSFANFHLRLQFKWGEKRWGRRANTVRDSGLLYFGSGDLGAMDGSWPRSIEFQIQEHDCGDLYTVGTQISVRAMKPTNLWIYDPKGEPTVFASRRPAPGRCVKLEDAEKPRGEWNTLELVCLGGESIHVVNGKVVMRLAQAQRLDVTPLTSGNISLQTEGAEVFYRNVEIRPITEVPVEFKPGSHVDLFNGKDFAGWTFCLRSNAEPAKTWTVTNGVIHCSGKDIGYIRTEKSFSNYWLTVEWRFVKVAPKADNTGVLVHMQSPDKVWPPCIQVQGKHDRQGDLIFMSGAESNEHKGKDANTAVPMTGPSNEKSPGEWNTCEVECRGDVVSTSINGQLLNTGTGCTPVSGAIGFQSEGAEFEIRKATVQPLKNSP